MSVTQDTERVPDGSAEMSEVDAAIFQLDRAVLHAKGVLKRRDEIAKNYVKAVFEKTDEVEDLESVIQHRTQLFVAALKRYGCHLHACSVAAGQSGTSWREADAQVCDCGLAAAISM